MFSFFSSVHMCRSGDFVLIRGRERRPKGHSSEAYLVFPTTSLHIISVNNPHVNCHGISHLSLICNICFACKHKSKSKSTIHPVFFSLVYYFSSVSLLLWEWLVRLYGFLQKGNCIKAYQEKLWKHTKESVGCSQSTKAAQLTSLPKNQAFCWPDRNNSGNSAGRTCSPNMCGCYYCDVCCFVCLNLLINFD